VPSYITGAVIGVRTGPVADRPALWPHLKHYD
jgi:hypothetical protein